MTESNSDRRLTVAIDAATSAGQFALERFRSDLAVDTKSGKTDVVTSADRGAQRRARAVLGDAFPDDPLIGEENGAPAAVPEEGPAWIVDPIDGTNNFVRGVPLWSTAVAAVVDGEPVAAAVAVPALGDLYAAGAGTVMRNGDPVTVSDRTDPERCVVVPTLWWPPERRDEYGAAAEAIVEGCGDLRRYGSAQLALAMVAAGEVDATVTNRRGNPWDTVAGAHLVRRAGGRVTDLAGDRWRHDGAGLVASNDGIHDLAIGIARAADGARD